MVQDMPTPIMTHRGDHYKSAPVVAYVNGINGNNGKQLIGDDSSPAHPQLHVPMPMPMFHQHPGFFSQSMGPPPPPPPVMPVATAAPAPPHPAPPRPTPIYTKSPNNQSFSFCEYLYHVGFLQGNRHITFGILRKHFEWWKYRHVFGRYCDGTCPSEIVRFAFNYHLTIT